MKLHYVYNQFSTFNLNKFTIETSKKYYAKNRLYKAVLQIWLKPLLGTQRLKNLGRYYLSRGACERNGIMRKPI